MTATIDRIKGIAHLDLDADELSEIVAAMYDTLVCHAGEMPRAQAMYERLSAMLSHMMPQHPVRQNKPGFGSQLIRPKQTSLPGTA